MNAHATTAVTKKDGAAVPFYLPQRDEIEISEAADCNDLPVLVKGPTGCGKNRFVS